MYTRFTHRCTTHQCKSTFPTLLVNSLFFGTISEFLQSCLGSISPEAIVDWDHQQNPTSSRLNLTLPPQNHHHSIRPQPAGPPPQNHHHSIRPQPAGPRLRATVMKFKKGFTFAIFSIVRPARSESPPFDPRLTCPLQCCLSALRFACWHHFLLSMQDPFLL